MNCQQERKNIYSHFQSSLFISQIMLAPPEAHLQIIYCNSYAVQSRQFFTWSLHELHEMNACGLASTRDPLDRFG